MTTAVAMYSNLQQQADHSQDFQGVQAAFRV
jgi:hypothetical protein